MISNGELGLVCQNYSSLCSLYIVYGITEEFAKKIYSNLISFHHQGFTNWATGVVDSLDELRLNITMTNKSFAVNCIRAVQIPISTGYSYIDQDGPGIFLKLKEIVTLVPKPPLLRYCVAIVTKLKMRITSWYIAVLMHVKGTIFMQKIIELVMILDAKMTKKICLHIKKYSWKL